MNKKLLMLIIGIAVVAVALILVLGMIIMKTGSKKDNTTPGSNIGNVNSGNEKLDVLTSELIESEADDSPVVSQEALIAEP